MFDRGIFQAALGAIAIAVLCTATTGQSTERVSVDSNGNEAFRPSVRSSISGDGRVVAYWSEASSLVLGDTNQVTDVFVHDRRTHTTVRVSVDSNGVQGDRESYENAVSANGRFVAFDSKATNLVPGDTNNDFDVFVHDLETGITTCVSVDSAGVPVGGDSAYPSISADGRFVAFHSRSGRLVTNDTNGFYDVFVRDRQSGTTTRVSLRTNGREGDNNSLFAGISGDGRLASFQSTATNLVPRDTNDRTDIFVHDLGNATTVRVSVDTAGIEGNEISFSSRMSPDGRVVAFVSAATNLVPNDTNGASDIFVHELQTSTTSRVSVDSTGAEADSFSDDPSLSADGRFVAFQSYASNLVRLDRNGEYDIFVHDRRTGTTSLHSVDAVGDQGNRASLSPALSADGRLVCFFSAASDLVPGDTNLETDVFVQGRELLLEASPESVSTGAGLTLSTWTGRALGPVLLFVVDVNGIPLFHRVLLGVFDATGLFEITASVPPGLAGNVVTLQSFGLTPSGRIDSSNTAQVTFQ